MVFSFIFYQRTTSTPFFSLRCDGREADGTGSVEIVGGLPYWETKSFWWVCYFHYQTWCKQIGFFNSTVLHLVWMLIVCSAITYYCLVWFMESRCKRNLWNRLHASLLEVDVNSSRTGAYVVTSGYKINRDFSNWFISRYRSRRRKIKIP
jgi:hypothetical protein